MQVVGQKILRRTQEKKMMAEWATETMENCKEMAIQITQAIFNEMNKEILENKALCKEQGFILKKERKLSLLTVLGTI